MNLNVYMQLLLLCVLNIIFTFSGIILNALVIASFGKSSQLRKKSCHFMIMVLSCFDLVSVVTNNPGLLFYIISWLMEKYDLLLKMEIYFSFTDKYFWVFFAYTFRNEHWTISGSVLPDFSSHIDNQAQIANSCCDTIHFSHCFKRYLFKRLNNFNNGPPCNFYRRYISTICVYQFQTVQNVQKYPSTKSDITRK